MMSSNPLPACPKLNNIHLARNGFFGLEAVKKMAKAWSTGASPELATLDLSDTCIFSAGARKFATALLRWVRLHGGCLFSFSCCICADGWSMCVCMCVCLCALF